MHALGEKNLSVVDIISAISLNFIKKLFSLYGKGNTQRLEINIAIT